MAPTGRWDAGSGRERSVAAMSAPSGPRSRGLVPASPVAEVTPDVHRKNGATSAGALLTGVFSGGCIARRPCRTRSDTAADCDSPCRRPRTCARSSRCRKGRCVPTPADRRGVRQGVACRHARRDTPRSVESRVESSIGRPLPAAPSRPAAGPPPHGPVVQVHLSCSPPFAVWPARASFLGRHAVRRRVRSQACDWEASDRSGRVLHAGPRQNVDAASLAESSPAAERRLGTERGPSPT